MSSRPPSRPAHADRLEGWLRAGIRAVSPEVALASAIEGGQGDLRIAGDPVAPGARVVAIAIGKAACSMALELERRAGDRIARGLAITKDGHALALERFAVREAAHPVPDARSERSAREALALAASTRPEDVLVVLLSGGASALTALPGPGLSLADLARTGEWLLACGADIEEMNCVRKHLGAFGGGRLAAAAPARRIELLAISDVPGDRLDVIGSGPCTADPSHWADALAVVEARGGRAALPSVVLDALERGAVGELAETPKPGAAGLDAVRATLVARNADARRAIAAAAAEEGLAVCDAGERLGGEARDQGARVVAHARGELGDGAPGLWVAGGETTVELRGTGQGGRSQELALAAAIAGAGSRGWSLLAAGTDGGDGPTDAAGAIVDGDTVARGAASGVDAASALADNDSHAFFAAEGGLVRTGPTHTNVMDVALVALSPNEGSKAG